MTAALPRRAFLARGAAFAVAVSALPLLDLPTLPATPRAYATAADNAARATAAYAAMQQYFYLPTQKLYQEHHPRAAGDQAISFLWSFEEAARATLAMYSLPNGAQYAADIQARRDGRETYWDGATGARAYRSYPQTGDRYYDDNDWVGHDLLLDAILTGDGTTLSRAQGVFSYVQTGWQPGLPNPGGIRWVDATWNGDRGMAATSGFAMLGAHLYDATGRGTQSYLDWAQRAYDWTKRYLLSPQNGLYWNAMRADGAIDQSLWIYNQGVLIGASVQLYRATGSSSYLTEARRLADASLAFFGNNGADPYYSAAGSGVGPYPGRGIFNAIFFRNLMLLYAVQPAYIPPSGVSYLQRAQTYADTAWGDFAAQGRPGVRDSATNLFNLHGGGEYSLLDQAGMVQVYATLAPVPASCTPRPHVAVTSSRSSSGRLAVVVTAATLPATPSNWLRRITFGKLDNASVDIRGFADQRQPFAVELPERTRQVDLSVGSITPGPFLAQLVVEDDCGAWPTFVGAGSRAS
jgi:hypothetical protein